MSFTYKVILFTCVIVINGFLTGFIMSNILPDLDYVILITAIIAISICYFSGFLLQFVQATFFDKKLPEGATESLLDYSGKKEIKLSDNKIWPYKLALIFSFACLGMIAYAFIM